MNVNGRKIRVRNKTIQKYIDLMADRTFREFLSDWKWVLSYTKKRRCSVVLYTVLGLLTATLGVASAYVTGRMINIISERRTEELALYIGLTAGVTVVLLIANAIKSRVAAKVELWLIRDIQSDLFGSIFELRWSELSKYRNGDLLNRFNKDMEAVMNHAISWIPSLLVNLYTFVITGIILFRMDPVMAWIGLGSAPFLFFISRFILHRQKQYQNQMRELDSDMMSFEAESFYNMDTVKAFGVWDFLNEKLTKFQNQYRLLHLDYNLFQIKTNTGISLLTATTGLGALAYCLFRLWTGAILFGDMTFFLTQRGALTSLFFSLMATIPDMLNASVSAHRIREFVGLPKEAHDPASFKTLEASADKGLSLEVQNLSFSYADGEKVYENVTFSAHPGQIIAVIGESGAGKTTLFRLLLGLVLPEKGKVVLTDADGNEVGMNADLRRFISYVPQGNTMMMGTIAENMRLVRKSATDEEIIEALKTACAWEFAEPIGINGQLGERGKGISEGQAQRLSIARAVLRDAPILFLDEATSALDEETETRVLDNVVRSSPNKTIIVSTHRHSVLKKCARVYQIKGKQIAELE